MQYGDSIQAKKAAARGIDLMAAAEDSADIAIEAADIAHQMNVAEMECNGDRVDNIVPAD